MSESAKVLLTVTEAASTLLCSRRRVFQLIADGTLVRGPRYGKQTVVLAESVFAAAEKGAEEKAVPRRRRVRAGGAAHEAALREMWK